MTGGGLPPPFAGPPGAAAAAQMAAEAGRASRVAQMLPPPAAAAKKPRARAQYAYHDQSGGVAGGSSGGGAGASQQPQTAPALNAPAMYSVPGRSNGSANASAGTEAAVAAPAPYQQPPPQHTQPQQHTPNYTPLPARDAAAAPNFGQRGAPSKSATNRIDPKKIPRPSSLGSGPVERYCTDLSAPDFATTVPHACGDYVVSDMGSCSPRFIRLTLATLPSSREARNLAAIPVGAIVQPLASLAPGGESSNGF
jgi:protein transport protein SEC24